MQLVLTSELILEAYRHGLFPMAYSSDSEHIHWLCPEERGQLSITDIHIPRSLLKTIRSAPYEIRINTDFAGVIERCAEMHDNRPETWINASIIKTFCELHQQGHAHSIEAWQDGTLIGGLYGLAMGGAFFGESMFSRKRDASKICLIHLCARLWQGGFTLLDTQFVNDHLQQFGIYEIGHDDYKTALESALEVDTDFLLPDYNERDLINAYLNMRTGG